MKRLISICLLLVAITTATFAGTGITTTVQNRTLTVEVVDNNFYNVTVLSETKRVLNAGIITQRGGVFTIDMPEGNDYIELVVTDTQTGVTEIIPLRVE